MLSYPSLEYDEVVAEVCRGTAGEDRMRALNILLRSDPAARDEYLLRVEIHTRLASDPELFTPVNAVTIPDCALPVREFPAGRTTRTGNPPASPISGRFGPVLALAACLTIVVLGVWAWRWNRVDSRSGGTSNAVAMLTRVVEARWSRADGLIKVGSALKPGWVHLEAGLAEIVFYSGARVVVEGPAALQLVSRGEVTCQDGRLLAEVPQPAHGFKVNTDQLNVVDLGTEFGLEVKHGRTEVHVFKGEVEFWREQVARQPLVEGQAASAQGGAAPSLMPASKVSFGSLFEFQKRFMASETERYDQWRLASDQLNLDPSLLVHLDFENLNGSSWTLGNKAGKSRKFPDATIVGCQRGEGRWRDKQALEFQSVNDRVRLAVAGEWESLTLSTWVNVKGLDRKVNSLFMSDGFGPGTVHWVIRQDGVLGLTVFGEGFGKYQIVASPPVLRLDSLGMWLHLAVVLDGRAKQVAHYVNGLPVSTKPLKISPFFRVGAAELGNWNASGSPEKDPSLIRNFSGAMDEFCLFGRALDDGEIRALYSIGKPQAEALAGR